MWSRSSDRARKLEVGSIDIVTSTTSSAVWGVLEARSRHDVQHRRVRRKDLEDEALDALVGRVLRELLEHTGRDPRPVLGVGHGERDLGSPGISQSRVAGQRDDALVIFRRERAQQRSALIPVRVEIGVDKALVRAHRGEEAKAKALGREARKEGRKRGSIGMAGLAQAKRSAITEDHIRRFCSGFVFYD